MVSIAGDKSSKILSAEVVNSVSSPIDFKSLSESNTSSSKSDSRGYEPERFPSIISSSINISFSVYKIELSFLKLGIARVELELTI